LRRPAAAFARRTRRTDSSRRDASGFDGIPQRVERVFGFRRKQNDVGTRFEGTKRRIGVRVVIRHAFHRHRVGEEEAAELEIFAKDSGHDGTRECGWKRGCGLHFRQRDVRRHHGTDTALDGRAERRQLDRVESGAVEIETRKYEMGVLRDVPVSREVFRGRDLAVFLCAVDVCGRHSGDESDVFAEGTNADDGILRVVVDVDDRIEIDVDSHRTPFFRGDGSGEARHFGIVCRSDRHRERKACCSRHHVTDPAFEIRGYEQWDLREALQPVHVGGDRDRVAAERVITADVVVDDVLTDLLELLGRFTAECRRRRRNQKLTDLLIERHSSERAFHPSFVGGSEPDRSGECSRNAEQQREDRFLHGWILPELRKRAGDGARNEE
jgi:hypothetical protein